MTERLSQPSAGHEKLPHHEMESASVHKQEQEQAHESSPGEKSKDKHELAQAAKKEAKAAHETRVEQHHKDTSQATHFSMHTLKSKAYAQSLQKIQAHLSPGEKILSKIIHRPIIETASEITGKTAARPSGLLGGGLVALAGSSFVLFMGKHYGFRYNFFVFIALFLIGFFGALGIELLLRYIRPKQN